jgi:hypothetical protein
MPYLGTTVKSKGNTREIIELEWRDIDLTARRLTVQ